MRNLRLLASTVGWALALSGVAKVYGADTEVNYCETPPNPPAGLAVTLALKNGQTVFRQGEIITLVSSTTSENEGEYIWNSKSYDRAGRNSMESFCIEPKTGPDPLRDYFDSRMGTIGGGLFGESDLGRKPRTTEFDLNEWFSLPPGRYRVSIVSYRVSAGHGSDTSTWNGKAIPLRSGEVEFTVVEAEPEWQAAQIAAAAGELSLRKYQTIVHDAENGDVYFDGDQRIRAKRILRFVGTRQSEHEIAVRFAEAPKNEPNWEYTAGLWAAADRSAVIEDMKAILRSHDKVNEGFVQDLVEMEMYSDPKWKSKLPKDWKVYLDEMNRRKEAYTTEIGTTSESTN